MSDIKVVANGNKIIVKPDSAGITITPNAVKIIVSSGGPQGIPGTGAVWGGIGGTLSNQTDLQTALDGKATSAQGALADSSIQPLDNVSELTNDAGYITSAGLPSDTDDLPEGLTNLYYTDVRVAANSAVAANTSKVTLPAGGTARQILTKIDGTDFNTEWGLNWNHYAMLVEYTGVETTIASGIVSDCTIDGNTIYRFVNSTNNANGYPTEDSFYSDFTDPNLTNLIVTRG